MNWFAVLFVFGLMLLVFWIVRAHQKQNADKAAKEVPLAKLREKRAAELGWNYDGTYVGNIRYRFSGVTDQGHRWELRYDSDASSSVSQPKIIFEISSLRSERTQFEISAGKSFELMHSATGKKVSGVAASIAWAVGSKFAQDTIAFCRDARIQPLGSDRLRDHFKVIAYDLNDVGRLIDSETESLLLNWPRTVESGFDPFQQVVITHGPRGLLVECRYDSTDLPLFEHLVALGCALAARVKMA